MNLINSHQVVHKLPSEKEFIYDVMSVESISKEITRIMLHPSNDIHLFYEAGQYIKIIHANGDISPLSIANAPRDDFLIELHLTHPPDNLQAQDILHVIANEKKLVFRGPYGSCTARELFQGKSVIFLARGTGFAPIKAMIEEKIKDNIHVNIHFYWSVTSPQEFYLQELLDQWQRSIKHFSFTPLLSRPHADWQGKTGWLQESVLQDYPDITKHRIFVSAPEPIVHDVLHVFERAGLPRKYYYSDVFDYDPNE